MTGVTRRQTLAFGMAATGAVGLGAAGGAIPATAAPPAAAPGAAPAADEYETLRLRWAGLLTGGEIDATDPDYRRALDALDAAAAAVWKTMDTAPDAATPWPDLPLTAADAVNANACLNRLLTLATAWATGGAALSADADVLAGVLAGLRVVYRSRYNESVRETGNWWNWEIGSPKALVQICALLGAEVPTADLADYLRVVTHFVPNPDRRTNLTDFPETGANRMDKVVIVALRGILARDGDALALARDGVSDTRDSGANSIFQYVTSGDGFYRDGSFIQHDSIPYAGSYGTVLLDDMARIFLLLAGSSWEITDPNQTVVFDAVEATFAPFLTGGAMMDAVRGRAISRQASTDHDTGHGATASVLMLAAGAPDAYADRFRQLAKGWIGRERFRPYLATASLPELAAAKAVLADASVRAAPEPVYHRQYPHQDRIVHRRRDWSFTIGLSSSRIFRYECGNGENLHGWYTGDGMTYLYTAADAGQFADGYWPTVDPYRLPGITVGTEPRADTVSTGTSGPLAFDAWVGGAGLADRYGAVGMAFTSYDKTISARKSWFCLDDAIVALGAGIGRTGDAHPVLSIVENRNLHADGTDRLLVDGRTQPTTPGWSTTLRGPRWAHLAGVGGYVFDGRAALHAARAERTGAWSDLDTGADTGGGSDPITRRYLSLWFDHGATPANAAYSYVLLPTASVSATARWAARPNARVLANTATVQAIRVGRPDLLLANFFAAGSVDRLAVDGPASVALGRDRGRLTLAVSDPSRTATSVTVRLPYPVRHVVSADDTVALTATHPQPVVTVAVGGTAGATQHATFSF